MFQLDQKLSIAPLNRTLQFNAIFSSICGLIMLVGADTLAPMMGGHHPLPYRIVGAFLVVYAADIWYSVRKGLTMGKGLYFVMGDFTWVLGTAIMLLGWGEHFSTMGMVAVAITSVFVLSFGISQDVHLIRAHRLRRLPA